MTREQLMNELRNRGVYAGFCNLQMYVPNENELVFMELGSSCNLDTSDVNANGVPYDGYINYAQYLWDDGDDYLEEYDGGMYMYVRNKEDNTYGDLFNRVFDTLCFIYGEDKVAADNFEVMILHPLVKEKPELKKTKLVQAAFVQKPLDEGITIEEITELVGRLECEQVIPIEVQANSSCAIGFISLDAAEELDYDYDNLIRNVSEVIEDMDNETEYGNYDFDGIPVYIGY